MKNIRNLVLVLGDQLDYKSAAFEDFDVKKDVVWMAENEHEITYVPTHKQKIVFFLSCMRHFRDELTAKKIHVLYHELKSTKSADRAKNFKDILMTDIKGIHVERLKIVQPGDLRVCDMLKDAARTLHIPIEFCEDDHFYCSRLEFEKFAKGKKLLLLEHFYRMMRKKYGILMKNEKDPVGGEWNLDKQNRESFGKISPEIAYRPLTFKPDKITQEVIKLVETRFKNHPGSLENFSLPVNRIGARKMLDHFIQKGLKDFGRYEDAMLSGEPFLYHSRLSALLNVKLLNPRECVDKAVDAYEKKNAPLNSVEGFVRQILGWREFIRGIYWNFMPGYLKKNYLEHNADLPSFYWDGETHMNCLKQCIQQVLDYGYAHHIQRLMVLGLFALLYGVNPRKFHDWHMAMYLDAIDWVSLPNTLGMSQYGDGGIVGTKPYCATGNYVDRMSNYCKGCTYDPKDSSSENACPFTVLYWDFLDRHYSKLKKNMRLSFAIKQLEKKRSAKKAFEVIKARAKILQK